MIEGLEGSGVLRTQPDRVLGLPEVSAGRRVGNGDPPPVKAFVKRF